jgi:small subunit ribosomal protein S17
MCPLNLIKVLDMPKRQLVGKVVSNKMAKTLVVAVSSPSPHAKYAKVRLVTKRYYVHDEHEIALLGALVSFVESRPLSKLKRWSLLSVIEQPEVV